MHPVSIGIRNDRPRPHVVWIEPWGEDYTMLPGQELVVTNLAQDATDEPRFVLVETDGNTQVYVELGDYPQLQIDGVPVNCGHNRQAAIDSGVHPDRGLTGN